MERDVIRILRIGEYELETDSSKVLQSNEKKLEAEGKVEGRDFFVREITPLLKGKEVRRANDKRRPCPASANVRVSRKR